jgi:hypothetical protein
MGADAAAGRHDGTPPGEDEIAARMRAEDLRPHGWGNGPGDTYAWHEHGYEKGAVLRARRDRVLHRRQLHRARPGRQDGAPAAHRAPRTRQRSARKACAASKRPASETRAQLAGYATWLSLGAHVAVEPLKAGLHAVARHRPPPRPALPLRFRTRRVAEPKACTGDADTPRPAARRLGKAALRSHHRSL